MILISGNSGSGKTSVAVQLEKMGYKLIPTYTTRKYRSDEELGSIRISETEFEYKLSHNGFISYHIYNTNMGNVAYGIPLKECEENGNKSVIILAREYYEDVYHYIKNYSSDKMFMVYLDVDDASIIEKSFDDKNRGLSNVDLIDRLDRDRDKAAFLRHIATLIIDNNEFRLNSKEVADIIDHKYKEFIK